ncbi:U6 snRNA-associated Sm-like protein LSm4 [Plasmodiophora brassicae]
MLVELKNGETYNGRLVNIDSWMNLNMKDVVRTSRDCDRFWRLSDIYIRGNNIKYLRVPDETVDKAMDIERELRAQRGGRADRGASTRGARGAPRGAGRGRGGDRGGRGGRGGRGRGRGK